MWATASASQGRRGDAPFNGVCRACGRHVGRTGGQGCNGCASPAVAPLRTLLRYFPGGNVYREKYGGRVLKGAAWQRQPVAGLGARTLNNHVIGWPSSPTTATASGPRARPAKYRGPVVVTSTDDSPWFAIPAKTAPTRSQQRACRCSLPATTVPSLAARHAPFANGARVMQTSAPPIRPAISGTFGHTVATPQRV
jgi:hypothetical protein